MPKTKRNRRARDGGKSLRPGMASCLNWVLREVAPLLRIPKRPRTRSAQHLRNATIEVLEAVRALLDETIEWLREGRAAELKRIRIE